MKMPVSYTVRRHAQDMGLTSLISSLWSTAWSSVRDEYLSYPAGRERINYIYCRKADIKATEHSDFLMSLPPNEILGLYLPGQRNRGCLEQPRT